MSRSIDEAQRRIVELEQLVSKLRHGVNGVLTPALLSADRLSGNADPQVRRAGEGIASAIIRVTILLKATRDVVSSQTY